MHVSTSGDVIQAWRWIRDAPPVGFFKEFGGFKGHVDRWHYYNLHLPSTAVIIESGKQKYYGTLEDLNNQPEIRDAYLAA